MNLNTDLYKLVSKKNGLIILLRRGVFVQYEKTEKIDFENPVPEYLSYFDFSTNLKLSFESLPTFDCDNVKWSKIGIFCNTSKIDNILSNTAKNLKEI